MGNIKKINIDNIFIYLFLILFPFGQIIRLGFVQPLDVVAGAAALVAIFSRKETPQVFKFFSVFLFVASFSWIFSVFFFWRTEVLFGFLYLLRIWAYLYFFLYLLRAVRNQKSLGSFLENSLVAVTTISALFGWIQYFFYPNFRAFTVWGWDDHLLRISGTFLDPGYLGIILSFGAVILINRIIQKFNLKYLMITIFLVATILFTYSRASYVALIAGVFFLIMRKKELLLRFSLFLASFVFFIIVLPTSQNNVLKFTRVFSALNRIENYKETIAIFKSSPLFGVGFNNLCLAKEKTAGFINYASHSCSGSDSSVLLILATTGILGLFVSLYLVVGVSPFIKRDKRIQIGAIALALLVHSMFSNSLFYPWVLGYIVMLLALAVEKKSGAEVKN